MNAYETTATVEAQGQLRLTGVPFAAGSEVEVTLRLKLPSVVETKSPDSDALRWEGNVLVHKGVDPVSHPR